MTTADKNERCSQSTNERKTFEVHISTSPQVLMTQLLDGIQSFANSQTYRKRIVFKKNVESILF